MEAGQTFWKLVTTEKSNYFQLNQVLLVFKFIIYTSQVFKILQEPDSTNVLCQVIFLFFLWRISANHLGKWAIAKYTYIQNFPVFQLMFH